MRRRPPSRTSRSPKRVRVWSTTDHATTALAAAASANVDMLLDFPTAPGITVIRTHLQVTPTTAPAVGDRITFGLIIGRLSDVSDPTAAGALTPSQTDLDWMYWTTIIANPSFGNGGNNNTFVVDLRAKRKMEELNQVYLLSITNHQVAAVTYRIAARTLMLMP